MKQKLHLPMPMYFSFIILKSIHLLCCHLSSSYSVAVALVGWLDLESRDRKGMWGQAWYGVGSLSLKQAKLLNRLNIMQSACYY